MPNYTPTKSTNRDVAAMVAGMMTEAASESYAGRLAVANVIANRAYVGSYGAGIQGVVEAGKGTRVPQFSGPTRFAAQYDRDFTAMLAALNAGLAPPARLADAYQIASGVLDGTLPDNTAGATMFVGNEQAMLAESGGRRGFSPYHQNKFDAFGSLNIGTQTFGYGSKEEQQKAMQRAGLIHEPATGLTYDSAPDPMAGWAEDAKAAGDYATRQAMQDQLRGPSDFGAPVVTGMPESEARQMDLAGGVPDFAAIDAATPAPAVPTMPVDRSALPDMSIPQAPGYDPLSSVAAPTAQPYDPLSSVSVPAPTPSYETGGAIEGGGFTTGGGFGGAPPTPSYDPLSSVSAPALSGGFSWSGPLADRIAAAQAVNTVPASFSDPANAGSWGGTAGPGRGMAPTVGPGWGGDPESAGIAPAAAPFGGDARSGAYDAPAAAPGWAPASNPFGADARGGAYDYSYSTGGGIEGGGGFSTGGGFGGEDYGPASAPFGNKGVYDAPSVSIGMPDVPSVPDPQSTFSGAPKTTTTYETQKTLNPAWTSWQASVAALQAAPDVSPLDTTFGAVPSMVGLDYASSLPGLPSSVVPKEPPKYITTKVPVTIEAPVAPGAKPKPKPKSPDLNAQLAAAKWASDTTQAATDARLNATLAAGRPIVDPLTGQVLEALGAVPADQSGILGKLKDIAASTMPAWGSMAMPAGSNGGPAQGTGGVNGYGLTGSQIAAAVASGQMPVGPLGAGRGYQGTGYTINDIAANYYNGGVGGGVQVGGSNWAGNQGGLGGGWMGSNGGGTTAAGLNSNHGGSNGTGGLW